MEEFESWLRDNLFPDDFFNENYFEENLVLFSRPGGFEIESFIHCQHQAAAFSRQELFQAVMDACEQHQFSCHTIRFHVNIHDNCAWVLEWWDTLRCPEYPLPEFKRDALNYAYYFLQYRPAQEGGTTYVGLLGRSKDWLLLFDNSIQISFHGAKSLCDTLKTKLHL